MKQMLHVEERRRVLKLASLALTPIALAPGSGVAQTAPARVEESEEQARTLGYKQDAANVDKVRFPEHQAGQTCSTCKLYQGKPSEAWGPCPIFHGRQVSAKGWCHSYVPKA